MSNDSFKKIILKLFFLFVTLFNLIIFESKVYAANDYCYYPSLTNIELVINSVPAWNLHAVNYDSSLNFTKLNYTPSHSLNTALTRFPHFCHLPADFQLIYKNQPTFSCAHLIISFLQKKNIWHQSADDAPSFNKYCWSLFSQIVTTLLPFDLMLHDQVNDH